jgi:multidrug resistance protein, MATE family
MIKNRDFTETIAIAIPVVIGQLSTVLMTVMDNMVVGRLGEVSLSAASFANSCYILIAIFSMGALNPIPAVVAEARGAKNDKDLRQLLRTSIYLGLFHGVIGAILVYLFSLAMPFMGQPKEDVEAAMPFMWILALSNIPMCIFLAIKNYFDGLEETSVGMAISILGLLLNILFNIGLVFGHFGMPNLGLIGSAWATLISRILMVVAIIMIMNRSKSIQKYKILDTFDFQYFKNLLHLGIPMGFQLFFEVAAFAGAVIMIGWLPTATIDRSAHQIAIGMASLTFMGMLGLSIAGSVRVGEALGRKDSEGIKEAGKAALLLGIFFACICAFLLIVLRKHFVDFYGITNEAVKTVTTRLIIIAAFFQLFDGAQCIGAGLLRGMQDVKIPAAITFIAYVVIWGPLAYWLSIPLGFGVDGVWYAFVIALIFAAAALNWRFFYFSKKI